MDQIQFKRPCRFFPSGKCRDGDNCRFSHDPQDMEKGGGDNNAERWTRNEDGKLKREDNNGRGRGRGRGDDRNSFKTRDNNDFDENPQKRRKFDEDEQRGQRSDGDRNNFRGGFRGDRDNNRGDRGGYRGDRDNNRGGYRGDRDNNRGGYRGDRDNNRGDRDNNRGDRDNNRGDRDNNRGDRDNNRGDRDNNRGDRDNNRGDRDNNRGDRDNNRGDSYRGGFRGDRDNNRGYRGGERDNIREGDRDNNRGGDNNRGYKGFRGDRDNQRGGDRDEKYNKPVVKETKEMLKPIQSLTVEGFIHFLPLIEAEQSRLLGIVSSRHITFFPLYYKGELIIDAGQQKQLTIANYTIQEAWLQIHQNNYILMVSIQSDDYKASSDKDQSYRMLSLAIYPNILYNQTYNIINDVSLKEIVYCDMDVVHNQLFVFCNDGNIRIFDNQFQFITKIDLKQPIDSALQTSQDENQKVYLIGLRQGQLMILNGSHLNSIPHPLTQHALVEIQSDLQNRRILLIFWQLEKQTSQVWILNEQLLVEGPIHLSNKQIQSLESIKDHEQKNLLFSATELGVCEILQEDIDKEKYKQFSFYPHLIQGDSKLDRIIDIKKIELVNHNQVVQKYILIGRQLKEQTQNIDILVLVPY